MNKPLSVVVCTYNRAYYLRKSLNSLVDQTLAKTHYEILVVDNGSTDTTHQVILEEFASVPNLRYLFEPTPGASHARNTGWQNSKGEYVAYLDHDAVASRSWCEKILEVFDSIAPLSGFVGGKVEPIWLTSRPEWLSDTLLNYFNIIDWSPMPTVLSTHQWLVGCNMAFPKHLLKNIGGFPTYLGIRRNVLLAMEEVMLQRKLQNQGYHCFYHPEILVQHYLLPDRLKQDWFLRRAWWNGISVAYGDIYQNTAFRKKSLYIGTHSVRNLISALRWTAMTAIATTPSARLERACFALERLGYLWGMVYRMK